MANPQIDILQHRTAMNAAGKKANTAINTCCRFLEQRAVKQFAFWPEDFDAICQALKDHGHRHDGFKVGNIKAVKYNEGR